MKKVVMFIFSMIFVLGLSACSQAASWSQKTQELEDIQEVKSETDNSASTAYTEFGRKLIVNLNGSNQLVSPVS